MSSVQYFREFISERLTAAAEEIFLEFEKTIVQYENVIHRQRKLLDSAWRPKTNLQLTEPRQLHANEQQMTLGEQQISNNEGASGSGQQRVEPVNGCSSEQGKQLVVKQENDSFLMVHSPENPQKTIILRHQGVGTSVDQGGELRPIKQEADSFPVHQRPSHNARVSTQPKVNLSRIVPQQPSTEDGDSGSAQDESKRSRVEEKKNGTGKHTMLMRKRRPLVTTLSHPNINFLGQKRIQATAALSQLRARTNLRSLKNQQSNKVKKSYQCQVCGKRYLLLPAFKLHLGDHIRAMKLHPCNICGRVFKYVSMLRNHMKSHREAKPAPCTLCARRLSSNNHAHANPT